MKENGESPRQTKLPEIRHLKLLIADDDIDDRFFFQKALKELQFSVNLVMVHDGEELMGYLEKIPKNLPDILFLDLSMPRKTGFECLTEIKENEILKDIPVVMFSTSFPRDKDYENDMISLLLKIGADDFIRKPGDFGQLKEAISRTLLRVASRDFSKKISEHDF